MFFLGKKSEFQGYTAIAHNLRGFDGIFVLKGLLENGVCPDVIVNGQKITVITVQSHKFRFIDSFNFLPMGLSKLPEAFALDCGSKGYFPHFFNTPGNQNYIGPLPDKKFYGIDTMGKNELKKFEEWYQIETERGAVFNFTEEMKKYCIQDVDILAASCMAYRKLMCEETDCDPFAYLTCASVCNAVYKAKFMPANTIARVPPNGYGKVQYSNEALEWLEYLRIYEGKAELRHAGNSPLGEKQIGDYFVDGFHEETNTVFEYYGCFFHGCQNCFPDRSLRNPITKKALIVLYYETMEREAKLRKLGYNIISIWGCEWKTIKENNPIVAELIKILNVQKPLNPREAFYGGRTETFKLGCSEKEINYEDFTSLYPSVNFTQEYPIGHPRIITCDFADLESYFGIIKCSVIPPKELYIPVLPVHCGVQKKLIFPLCNRCSQTWQTKQCTHSPSQRELTGTWFTEEVKLAVQKGYTITKIHSVWHFEERSNKLFKEYVQTFYKKKLLSSKLQFSTDTEIDCFIKQVKEKEGIDISGKDDFQPNPGLRQLTKLMLNNLWGRYGMRENLCQNVFVSRFEKLVKMLLDPTIEVVGVRLVTEKIVQIIFKNIDTDFVPLAKDTNIFIAVTTTAWARICLYKALDKIGERVIYCDTDSVIYEKSENPKENLQIGGFLGEMTNELDPDDYIVDFVSGGPKNYAYCTLKGKIVVKIKGFTLNAVNASTFSFVNIKNIILGHILTVSENNQPETNNTDRLNTPSFSILEYRIKTQNQRGLIFPDHTKEQANAIYSDGVISVYNPRRIFRSREWTMLQKPEQKVYSFYFDKRIILSNQNTIPYGYVGSLG
jgi:hypothetical protein